MYKVCYGYRIDIVMSDFISILYHELPIFILFVLTQYSHSSNDFAVCHNLYIPLIMS